MILFICQVCGHVSFTGLPEACPVCHAAKEKFSQNDNVFKEKGKKCIYIYFLREMLGMWVFSFAEAWGN